MKKLTVLLVCLFAAFSMSGCINDEVATIFERSAAAEAEYTSYRQETSTRWYVENHTDYYTNTFEQEESATLLRLIESNDVVAHGTLINNRGTSIETTSDYDYYQKGNYGYYDVKGLGRYKQKSMNAEVNDIGGDFISSLTASDFKTVSVKDVDGGKKRMRFVLNPKAVPEDVANEFLLNHMSFMSNAFDIVGASFLSLEYTFEYDKNYLATQETQKATLKLELADGSTARATSEETHKFYDYTSIEGDHLVFPPDLKDYMDYAEYKEFLKQLNKKS